MDGNLRISEGSKWGIIRSVTWDNRNFRWESEPVVINPRLTFIVMIIFNKNTLRNYVFDYLRIVNTEEYCTMNETAISTHFIFIILRNIENLLDEFSLILSEMSHFKWQKSETDQYFPRRKPVHPGWHEKILTRIQGGATYYDARALSTRADLSSMTWAASSSVLSSNSSATRIELSPFHRSTE